MKAIVALALCACVAGSPALAQERIYRCGSSYSQSPCAAAVTLVVDDARTADQRHDAQLVAARDAKLAEAMSRERRQRENATQRQGAGHIGPSRAASAPEKAPRPKAPRKGDGRRTHEDSRLTPPLKALQPAG
ncbi:MAG: hypothetical protein U1E89_04770 [Burkholderiaceae bacterium]